MKGTYKDFYAIGEDMTNTCFCNAYGQHRCCLCCEPIDPGAGGCRPCDCSKGDSLCLQTDQTKLERIRDEENKQ